MCTEHNATTPMQKASFDEQGMTEVGIRVLFNVRAIFDHLRRFGIKFPNNPRIIAWTRQCKQLVQKQPYTARSRAAS